MAYWTPHRIARLGYLAGLGASVDDILADDTVAARSVRSIRCAASRLGVPIGGGGLPIALSSDDRRRLDDAARARGITSGELALTVLRVVMRDDLIEAVIDDDGPLSLSATTWPPLICARSSSRPPATSVSVSIRVLQMPPGGPADEMPIGWPAAPGATCPSTFRHPLPSSGSR